MIDIIERPEVEELLIEPQVLADTGGHHFKPWLPVLSTWKPKLIGLHGPARSGKDTVGGFLKDAFGVQTVAFALPIKESLRTMMGLTDEHLHGSLKEAELDWLGKSPRQLMQLLGTEWGRGLVNDSIWLILAEREIDRLREDELLHVAVTDVRFENEAEMIRAKGGVIWHIERPGIQKVTAHASESGLKFQPELGDIKIINNGTFDDLLNEVCDQF